MRKNTPRNLKLVLITSVLASCAEPPNLEKDAEKQRVYMRADSTAAYTEVTQNYNNSNHSTGMGSSLLWFMAFRHMGGGLGYFNNHLHPQSVSGTNAKKASAFKAMRGGFGRSGTSTYRSSFGS